MRTKTIPAYQEEERQKDCDAQLRIEFVNHQLAGDGSIIARLTLRP
jgi:hypothetical protein